MNGAIVAAEALPETIGAKLYQFLNREKRAAPEDLPPFDLDEATKLLETPAHPDDIQRTAAAFGTRDDLVLPVGQQVARVSAYVLSKLPRHMTLTLAGPVPAPPPSSELYRFRRIWALAMRPLSIFDDLQEFAVSRDQAAAFADMFPSTFGTLWPQVQLALVRKKTAEPKWTPGRQKELLLRVLCKQEAPSLALAKVLQPIYAQEVAEEAAQQQTVRPKQQVTSSNEATEAQRAMLG
jgi:hypothetical protein